MLQVTRFCEPTRDKGFHVFVTEVCNGARPGSKRANFRSFFFAQHKLRAVWKIPRRYYAQRRFYSRSFFLSLSLSLPLMTLRRLGRALSGAAAGASTRSHRHYCRRLLSSMDPNREWRIVAKYGCSRARRATEKRRGRIVET